MDKVGVSQTKPFWYFGTDTEWQKRVDMTNNYVPQKYPYVRFLDDFIGFITENWKLSIVGALAIIVILKD